MGKLFHESMSRWLSNPEKKRKNNKKLFAVVAPKYHLATRILSFGRDAVWKRKLIRALPSLHAPYCVDLACGTGDLTFLLAKHYPNGTVVGVDISPEMLDCACKKNRFSHVSFSLKDMCMLKGMADVSVDIITGGYAFRNAPDLQQVLDECTRVLKPGGTLALLEFSKPTSQVVQKIQYILLKTWGSVCGLMLHKNHEVYAYIAESLKAYPDRCTLKKKLMSAGLVPQHIERLFFGMVEIIVCQKGFL